MASGYANRVITDHFPDLSEDGEDIFVVFRNPKTQPMSRLEADAVATGPDGQPDPEAATKAVHGLVSRLVLGGNLFDAREDGIDPVTYELIDQPKLSFPLTPESAEGLPLEVLTRIVERIREAQTPR